MSKAKLLSVLIMSSARVVYKSLTIAQKKSWAYPGDSSRMTAQNYYIQQMFHAISAGDGLRVSPEPVPAALLSSPTTAIITSNGHGWAMTFTPSSSPDLLATYMYAESATDDPVLATDVTGIYPAGSAIVDVTRALGGDWYHLKSGNINGALSVPSAAFNIDHPLKAVDPNLLCLLSVAGGAFCDQSVFARTVTLSGSASVSPVVPFFGAPSLSCPGAAPDGALLAYTSDLEIWNLPDATLDVWVYYSASTARQAIVEHRRPGYDCSGWIYFQFSPGDGMTLLTTPGTGSWGNILISGTSPSVGSWHLHSLQKSGSAFTLYLDGAVIGTSVYSGAVQTLANNIPIGYSLVDGPSLTGAIGQVRMSSCARYTGPFTLPTTPFYP